MNALPIVLLSVGCAVGAGVVTSIAMSPPAPVDAASSEGGEELARLRVEVSRLTRELETIQREAERDVGLSAPPSSTRLAVGDLDQAVRRYLDEHLAELTAEAVSGGGAASDASEEARTAQEYLEDLLVQGLDWDDQEAVWARVRESGRLDEVIALFEARAEARPDDPDAQVDVGHAYLQKIYELGDGPAAGLMAAKADQAYDRALGLDERHWEARFTKAVALSFWPPIFGKQQEAVNQFEVLLGQQEEGPVQENFAQSYLLLGNLYHQVGQADKARETWARGFVLFPGDEELSAKANEDGGGQ